MLRTFIAALLVSAFALLIGGQPAAAEVAAPTPAAMAATADRIPDGYRKATARERRAMNRVKGLDLTRKFGWYRGKKDPKYAFVCGYRDGGKWGVGIIRSNGRWKVWRGAPSGAIQSYAYYCGAF
jgi:hypothetical protein